MPIERNGKHWCDPASETPNKNGNWTCPGCKTKWKYWPEHRTWAKADEDLDALMKDLGTTEQKEGDE